MRTTTQYYLISRLTVPADEKSVLAEHARRIRVPCSTRASSAIVIADYPSYMYSQRSK